jgi:hypothetical protein
MSRRKILHSSFSLSSWWAKGSRKVPLEMLQLSRASFGRPDDVVKPELHLLLPFHRLEMSRALLLPLLSATHLRLQLPKGSRSAKPWHSVTFGPTMEPRPNPEWPVPLHIEEMFSYCCISDAKRFCVIRNHTQFAVSAFPRC